MWFLSQQFKAAGICGLDYKEWMTELSNGVFKLQKSIKDSCVYVLNAQIARYALHGKGFLFLSSVRGLHLLLVIICM